MRERQKNKSVDINVGGRDKRGANDADSPQKTILYAHHLLLQLHKAANAEGLHCSGGINTGAVDYSRPALRRRVHL